MYIYTAVASCIIIQLYSYSSYLAGPQLYHKYIATLISCNLPCSSCICTYSVQLATVNYINMHIMLLRCVGWGSWDCSSRIAMCTPCMATDFLYSQLDGHVIDSYRPEPHDNGHRIYSYSYYQDSIIMLYSYQLQVYGYEVSMVWIAAAACSFTIRK